MLVSLCTENTIKSVFEGGKILTAEEGNASDDQFIKRLL